MTDATDTPALPLLDCNATTTVRLLGPSSSGPAQIETATNRVVCHACGLSHFEVHAEEQGLPLLLVCLTHGCGAYNTYLLETP